jgi:4-hydroxy-tetrahydrodipicolinate reductase
VSDPVKVLVVGTGQMGSGIARLVLEKRGLALVGACARRSSRAGIDVGSAIGLGRGIGIEVATDLAATIERCRPHVAIQATCSKLVDAADEIATLAAGGVHVISIAEEMAFPRATSPELAVHLHQQAIDNGVCILGTGINPGFVLDLLVIALSGVCCHVDRIRATRVNDLSPYGPSVLCSQGVGLTPEAFRRGVEDESVVGHVGFSESLHMIAAALGWEIERIEQTREPIVSSVVRETAFVRVAPGLVAGCHHTAVAFVGGRPAISLIHPQQVHPELEGVETGDSIEILGTPDVRMAGTPEIPGGTGTIALAVNSIPLVLGASPGLYSTAELPVPAAVMADARSLVRRGGQAGLDA